MTREELLYQAHHERAIIRKNGGSIRLGQALWNVAEAIYPNKIDAIRATDADCFYDNEKIDAFLDALYIPRSWRG